MTIDLASLGRELKKPVENVQSAIDLLDAGNTIPFITRFRKDQTGGLNEEQLLLIKQSVARLRALAERRTFIRKSIESQEKLTDSIGSALDAAQSSRELEDIYLPFKPKKQTLATVAKQNGLEPLANDIFAGREPEIDLATRATDFVRVDKQLNSVDEVIAGVGHILAERFSDNVDLRVKLRKLIRQNGKLTTQLIPPKEDLSSSTTDASTKSATDNSATENSATENSATENSGSEDQTQTKSALPVDSSLELSSEAEVGATAVKAEILQAESQTESPDLAVQEKQGESTSSEMTDENVPTTATTDSNNVESQDVRDSSSGKQDANVELDSAKVESTSESAPSAATQSAAKPPNKKKKKKKSKKKSAPDPYSEFEKFAHPVLKLPYHKTLAINRGEKSGRLKVKIQFDENEFLDEACATLVPSDHPFADFMNSCARDAMTRLVIPSVEREIRRELTDAAEKHAVLVFAKNLKNLLLQSPVSEHRVLAIDPGYKRGCSVAVIDRGGQVLDSSHVFVVGNEQRKTESKEKLAKLIKQHSVALIAIGNGTACRETEELVSDLINSQLKDQKVQYAMVNEAGASVYSTSEVGREELPENSPAVRSAVSIGRRLIDPLSELVKISPANIGVGLYQHDIKAKHLAETLDDVVQFCVNRVGVDVNTASPSLLRYVSGLNQLTARRLYEFRQQNGAFKNREQLKEVAGFGDATFVQSAGFLRIRGGDHSLDSTGVHPENYDVTAKIIESANGDVEELFPIAKQIEVIDAKEEIADSTGVESSSILPSQSEQPTTDAANADASSSSEPNSLEASTNEPVDVPTVVDENDSSSQQQSCDNANADSESTGDDSESTGDDSESTGADVGSVEATVNTLEQKSAELSATKPPTQIPKLTEQQKNRRRELVDSIRKLDYQKLSKELEIGELLLRDIINSICKPEFDPRRGLNRPVFRSGIIKIDDLKKDLCLEAQVVNVVDFGVFVDIGLGTSCLVHVSQLASYFIRDPHRFFAVGDVLKVWVTEVDATKRRVTLTAIKPESLRQPKGNRSGRGGNRSGASRPNKKPGKYSKRSSAERRKPKRPPKPVKPITDEMLQGSEPMRSFSDLAQFYDKQSESEKGKGKS